jgi:L-amino acid N-acyltransferase YncA
MTSQDGNADNRVMVNRDVVRDAQGEDCASIAEIYNEGITEGRSTFETKPRSAADVNGWLGSPEHPVLVVESGDLVAGWARIAPYSPRPCYAGIGEASVYVRATARGRGFGGALAAALRERAKQTGLDKLVGKCFTENRPAIQLVARHGFREVGVHIRHGQIGSEWRDVLLVELLVGGRPVLAHK